MIDKGNQFLNSQVIPIQNEISTLFALGHIGEDLADIVHVLLLCVIIDLCINSEQQIELLFNLFEDASRRRLISRHI